MIVIKNTSMKDKQEKGPKSRQREPSGHNADLIDT